jgi:hypothetical protein
MLNGIKIFVSMKQTIVLIGLYENIWREKLGNRVATLLPLSQHCNSQDGLWLSSLYCSHRKSLLLIIVVVIDVIVMFYRQLLFGTWIECFCWFHKNNWRIAYSYRILGHNTHCYSFYRLFRNPSLQLCI